MNQHNSKRRIHVKGLGLLFAISVACGGVTHLAKATVAQQGAHISSPKYVFHHAFGFVHKELAFLLGHDARSILAAVLQKQQGVIDELVNRCVADNADDSTHGYCTRSG